MNKWDSEFLRLYAENVKKCIAMLDELPIVLKISIGGHDVEVVDNVVVMTIDTKWLDNNSGRIKFTKENLEAMLLLLD